jgi:AraC family transcriptional regulator of adaptative response/methylated-DNA-[protein]-cysteine methyltransferase
MQTTGMNYQQLSDDYTVVEQALDFLEENYQRQPTLTEIAASVGYSEYHFQRLFSRWVGISPKRFIQFLTKEHARNMLEESRSLLEISYETGLSGPGRLHDLFVTCEAVTPGAYKRRGEGLKIAYGFHPSPFGECLLAVTDKGICWLAFIMEGGHEQALEGMRSHWGRASLEEDSTRTAPLVAQAFPLTIEGPSKPLHLYLSGTNFQIKVWEALLRIPSGKVVTYQDLATYIGKPKASRAVGSAVGANPIPVLIPCHRVIRKMGVIGNYGGGPARKKAMLGWEMARNAELETVGGAA